MAKKYVVELIDEERKQLLALLKKGNVRARKLCRAQVLLGQMKARGMPSL